LLLVAGDKHRNIVVQRKELRRSNDVAFLVAFPAMTNRVCVSRRLFDMMCQWALLMSFSWYHPFNEDNLAPRKKMIADDKAIGPIVLYAG
jgi:hypothetical protein